MILDLKTYFHTFFVKFLLLFKYEKVFKNVVTFPLFYSPSDKIVNLNFLTRLLDIFFLKSNILVNIIQKIYYNILIAVGTQHNKKTFCEEEIRI